MEQRLRRAVFDRLEMLSEEASNAEHDSLVSLARTELRRLTDGWRELLNSHESDDDGRCRQCFGWFRRRRRWPCAVWLSAHHYLIGEGHWHRSQQVNQPPSPFGRRNPTIVIRRQLPPGASGAPRAAIEAAPQRRGNVVDAAPLIRVTYRSAS